MIMDAGGKIMPSCGGPRTDDNLVFGKFQGNGSDPFMNIGSREIQYYFRAADAACFDRRSRRILSEW